MWADGAAKGTAIEAPADAGAPVRRASAAMVRQWPGLADAAPAAVAARLATAQARLRRDLLAERLDASLSDAWSACATLRSAASCFSSLAAPEATPAARLALVMPVHNHARFLREALPPLLNDCASGEVDLVFLDDGSTDSIRPWMRAVLGSAGVRVLAGRLGSLPRALNAAVAATDPFSPMWSWTSADNNAYAGLYPALARAMDRPGARALGLGYANFRAIDDAGRPHSSVRWWQGRYLSPGDSRLAYPLSVREMMRTGENLVGPVFLLRAQAARAALPYDTGVQGIEDYDMWLRVIGALPAELLDDGGVFGYEYRVHASTLTESLDKPLVYARLLAMKAFEPMRQAAMKQACRVDASDAATLALVGVAPMVVPAPGAGDPAAGPTAAAGAGRTEDDERTDALAATRSSLGLGSDAWAGSPVGPAQVQLLGPEDLAPGGTARGGGAARDTVSRPSARFATCAARW
ncbi:hypothetical protein FNF29_06529 [Cafeteria roenbergensis]|uniref:Glycosyltransferase 2-like domain-containing protein n=1 Tax=Cafeteria roenbergensis TaxID=33653 RepID=A0A5A8C7W6_CAFRO|nr:hypothetical protein FNF29_06529 [Cafeteria roenbergensis]|eukprot:KAA0148747.1 hypothetical protein FNF29_06529 [Cafeteria roenbergensis]